MRLHEMLPGSVSSSSQFEPGIDHWPKMRYVWFCVAFTVLFQVIFNAVDTTLD
jgi:hypothetical protein